MNGQKPIQVRRCESCGADRGGILDLNSENPSFNCFSCANGMGVRVSGPVSVELKRVASATGARSHASLSVKTLRLNPMDQVREAARGDKGWQDPYGYKGLERH